MGLNGALARAKLVARMMLRKWYRPRAINKAAPFVSQGRQVVGSCGRSFTEGMNPLPDVVAESNAIVPAGGRRYEVQLRAAVRHAIDVARVRLRKWWGIATDLSEG